MATSPFKMGALTGFAMIMLASISDASPAQLRYDPQLPPLMPYPRQAHALPGDPVRLDQHSRICNRQPITPRLQRAIDRFRERLHRQQNIELPPAAPCAKLVQRAGTSRFEISLQGAPDSTEKGTDENTLAALNKNRAFYRLYIDADKVQLSAHSDVGLLHGLQTLSQYIGTDENQSTASARLLPAVQITDYPRFRWRGLMLDSVRHFFSVDTIKRQLDGMAAAKLNVFHWHLTDDQGWRLQSSAYPRLHETAPDGKFYTWNQVREIVAYAADRGIVVVPEIDMPGHASAIAVAYPELMSAPRPYKPEDRWGVHKPLLNPANPAVYIFAEKILGEVAALFPFEYVHIGGDEVDPQHWENNADIQRYMQEKQIEDSHALHNDFNSRLAKILNRLNRKMIGWDEILHPGLEKNAAVQSWRGPDALGDIARAGHFGILSTGFYLDQPQYTSYHYRNGIMPRPLQFPPIQADEQWKSWQFSAPRKRGSPVKGSFALVESPTGDLRGTMSFAGKAPQRLQDIERTGPYTTFRLDTWMGPLRARLRLQGDALSGEFVVGNTPYHPTGKVVGSSSLDGKSGLLVDTPAPLNGDQKKKILGGEAALWAEMVDEHNIDLRLWPRTFAVAERLWSDNALRDEEFLYQRLRTINHWAESALGLQHRAQQLAAVKKHFPEELQTRAMDFSAVLEPAHYYHRHHEKSASETYSRRDPLNRFADSLPVESIALRDFRQLLDRLPETPDSRFTRARLDNGLQHLKRAGIAADALLQHRDQLHPEIQMLAERVRQQMALSLLIADRFADREAFSAQEEADIRRQLATLKGMHAEVVLPAVYVLERLLDRLQYSGINKNEQNKGHYG